jgi:hypothetical protein
MKCAALSSLLLAAATVAACGPKPGGGAGPGSAQVALPDVPFDELDHDQRFDFMKQVVVPTLGPMFKRHDKQKFAKFGCKTCHGKGADRGEYHMPNDDLPKLNLADLSKYKQADIEFMQNDVLPTMARLVKQPVWTPENDDGFGCLECHPKE